MAQDAHQWVQGLRWERVLRDYWLPVFRVAEVMAGTAAKGDGPAASQ
jgi:hypothetical protein